MTTPETKQQKRDRLAALGYYPARNPGWCCLCGKRVAEGQYTGAMPPSWKPSSTRRNAHYGCIEKLKDKIRAKAERLGLAVPDGVSEAAR